MNKNLGIIDSEKAEILREYEQSGIQHQAALNYQAKELEGCIWADSKNAIHVADHERQFGTPMHFEVLEKIIRKLPNGEKYKFVDFKDHPIPALRARPFKAVYFMRPTGPLYISGYGKTILPEWSTMDVVEEEVPDIRITNFDRKDLPERVWKGWDKGFQLKNPQDKKPWHRKFVKAWGENAEDPSSRGWRTVFSRIVGFGLATPDQVEAVTSPSARQSWQNHMGRREDKLSY